ncbi:MAG: zinc-dependent metalloprotease [Actinobacteria bacterium]|nr:zinc-dependent metalloprotease [Actinomycetota bacterium]
MSGLPTLRSDTDVGPLADWALAERVARMIALRDQPQVTRGEVDRLRAELRDTVVRADGLAREVTGLGVDLPAATVRVVGRGEWLRSNLDSIAWLVDPLAGQLMDRSEVNRTLARKALGIQLGIVFGYLSTKVLGQYEVLLPNDEEPGRLTLVGPNLVELERQYLPTVNVTPSAFRMGVVLHELAHRLQFEGVQWLRPTLRRIVDTYLSETRLDADRLKTIVDRLGEVLRSAREGLSVKHFLEAVLTPAQRALMDTAQSMMALLEGHGNVVMDWGAELLAERDAAGEDVAGVRQALNERRKRGADRLLFKVLGLSMKARQYSLGEEFILEIERRHGREVFNQVWRDPAYLPMPEELEQPELWVGRVAG